MGWNTCVGLGDFGVLKIERKRFVPTKTCQACGRLKSGDNLGLQRSGDSFCMACARQKRSRYYWAKQMRAYFNVE